MRGTKIWVNVWEVSRRGRDAWDWRCGPYGCKMKDEGSKCGMIISILVFVCRSRAIEIVKRRMGVVEGRWPRDSQRMEG